MIRNIGQRGHEKRRKSGIVRGRGKAGGGERGGGWAKKKEKTQYVFHFLFFLCHPPPPPGLALPGLLKGFYIPPKP